MIGKPLRFPATASPGEGRIFRMAVLRYGGRTGGFDLDADQVGEGVTHFLGEDIQLGAGFSLLSILISGNGLGQVLLQMPQVLERQRLVLS